MNIQASPGWTPLEIGRPWSAKPRSAARSHVLGLLSLVSGTVVVSWPTPTLTVIAWIGGLHLVLFGIPLVASAFSIRRFVREGVSQ